MTHGLSSEKSDRARPRLETAHVLVEEDQRREAGRADRVALRDGLRRVADRVERVGDPAHGLGEIGHLGDAARVVGHRPVRVERDDEPCHRELRHDRDADAVQVLAGGVVRARRLPVAMTITGSAVACMPTARPEMMFVAWPVCEAFAMSFTGFQRVPV